jgi:fluoroquinolone resistance protein
MPTDIIEDQTFTKVTGESFPAKKGTFENCRFINCDFSYADFSKQVFTDCKIRALQFVAG